MHKEGILRQSPGGGQVLKGQLDVDMEFMGGTLLFVALAFITFMVVLLPLHLLDYNIASSLDDIDVMELSNLVKLRLESDLGDGKGNIDAAKLGSWEGFSVDESGLPVDFVSLKDIITGSTVSYGLRASERVHHVFSTVSASRLPVGDAAGAVMLEGRDYLVHIYRLGDDDQRIAMDIYSEEVCESGTGGVQAPGYPGLPCSDIGALVPLEGDVESFLRGKISETRSGEGAETAWVRPGSDVAPGDLLPPTFGFGSILQCRDTPVELERPVLCVRRAGGFVSPVRIAVLGEVR
jgi:hypothetical protein